MKFSSFQYLLAGGQSKNQVLIEEFSRTLFMFGPLEECEDYDGNVLEKIEDQLAKKAFHGPIDGTNAYNLLIKKRPGTYLIRFSASEPGCWAITYVLVENAKNTVKHSRVYRQPGGKFHFLPTMEDNGCDSIAEVIQVLNTYVEIGLKYPVSATRPYQQLFDEYKKKCDEYIINDAYPTDLALTEYS